MVIVKEIRDKLGLKPNQKFSEKIKGNKIIFEPIPSLVDMGGFLKNMSKGKTTQQLMDELDEGWE
jgi:bifunctional DNA-binding transcriptional regulator/antitoxin component of YhaV-PrlF toxin-antitoxin module